MEPCELFFLIALTILILTSGCIELEPTQEGIEIHSDSEFETLNFPGSGTIEDPYIIANHILKQTAFGILVEDTTKHFVITNCYIERFYVGIHLRSVSTGTGKIINNTIIDAYPNSRYIDPGARSGISIENSDNIIITNNTIINAELNHGINIDDSNNCIISQNRLSEHFTSIRLDNTKNIMINENSFIPTVESFYCSDMSNVTIQNNYCKGGLRLYDCYNSTINNNTIMDAYVTSDLVDGGHGIFASSSNCSYVNNRLQSNELYGVYLYSAYGPCKNNTLFQNIFLDNNLNGNQQAADDGQNNLWYNAEIFQGNYWSDWNKIGSYLIDGTANSYDLYPLSTDNLSLILI